jgi:hypothetical protein
MSNTLVKSNKNFSQYSRPLIASMLISGGFLQLAAPVLADGTPAGTNISNTATASYEDPTDSTKPLNTVSNTVEVRVAEVAGVTVTADTFAIIKGTGTASGAEAGDTINFDFTVTNVGNDPSKLRIPGTATLTGAGTVTKVQYFAGIGASGADSAGYIDIPNGSEYISDSKAPTTGNVKVRVVVSVLAGATANDDIVVTLGKTVTPGQQNVLRNADGGDVYTIDNAGTTNGDTDGDPENGVREASAFQTVTILATPQAFATVTKVRGALVPGSNTTSLSDDTLTYDLGLSVAGQAPSGSSKIAADLSGTPIKLGSTPTAAAAATPINKILVSDAVPAGTVVNKLTVPSGWTAVYTESPTATVNANDAAWVNLTDPAVVPTTATRIGFIKTTGVVAKGGTAVVFGVEVKFTSAFVLTGGKIANIAQVFGSTSVTTGTVTAPDLTKPVYDESGDAEPNNLNEDGSPNPTITNGVADPNDPSPDAGNDNTGVGPGGEPNVYLVTLPGQATGILNGTAGNPDAVGPNNNNDDFTNVAAPVPSTAGINGLVDPAAIGFANTFKVSGVATDPKKQVNLLPTVPSDSASLPTGTVVTVSYASISRSYYYTGTSFTNGSVAGGTAAIPLQILNVTPGSDVNYGVEINLPSATQLKGYGVPITAFIKSGTNPVLAAADAQNITIDRIYLGYLKLEKKAQILDEDGGIIEDYTASPTKKAAPNQMIRYQITYTNISEVAAANSGSVMLNAQKINIVEDSAANGNTWGLVGGVMTTVHMANSAEDTRSGTILFNNGTGSNTTQDVTVYKDTVAGPLKPQQSGNFRFTRIVK